MGKNRTRLKSLRNEGTPVPEKYKKGVLVARFPLDPKTAALQLTLLPLA